MNFLANKMQTTFTKNCKTIKMEINLKQPITLIHLIYLSKAFDWFQLGFAGGGNNRAPINHNSSRGWTWGRGHDPSLDPDLHLGGASGSRHRRPPPPTAWGHVGPGLISGWCRDKPRWSERLRILYMDVWCIWMLFSDKTKSKK